MITPLTTEEMDAALAAFANLQEQVKQDLSYYGSQDKIDKWIQSTVLLCKPAYMFRPDSIIELGSSIYSSEEITDYVYDLSFRFFSTWSCGENTFERICKSLTIGLELDQNRKDLCTIPEDIRACMPVSVLSQYRQDVPWWKRLFNRKITINDFLNDNRYLVIVLFLYLTNKLD